MTHEHPPKPFLLFDAHWLEQARCLVQQDPALAAITNELQRRCNALLDPRHPNHLDWDNPESRWWKTRMGSKQLVVAVWDLAMAANLFQDTRYSGLAVKCLDFLVEHDMAENCGGTCYGRPFKSWLSIPLDAGHAAEALGISLDLLLPFLDRTHAVTIGRYLKKFVDVLEGFVAKAGDEDQPSLHNIPMSGRFSVGTLAAALSNLQILDPTNALRITRKACLQHLEQGGNEEGVLCEGPMYGFACMKHMAIAGTILARRGDPAVWDSPAWDRVVEAYASQVVPCDGTIHPVNDCYPVRISSWLLAVAKHRRNGLARWLWESIVQPLGERRWDAPVSFFEIRAPWWNGLVPHALASYDPEIRPAPPAQAAVPLRRFFPARGILDDRTGWNTDDWYLTATCCSDVRYRSRVGAPHYQADRGHFSLYALGEKFAIDSGYGNELLSGSTEVIRFGNTGEAHSVPEVGGTMQRSSVQCAGFREIRTDTWALSARMDFPECYDGCSRVTRVLAAVPDPKGIPLYVAVHDSIIPRSGPSGGSPTLTYGLLIQTDEANRVEFLDRETVDVLGGRRGNRCRIIMTATRPGRIQIDQFLQHPRIRFQNQGINLHALTILIPYRSDETPPVFERTDPDNNTGFVGRLEYRGVTDYLALAWFGTVAAWGLSTDATFAIFRDGTPRKILISDGSFLEKDGARLFGSETRTSAAIALRE